MKKLILLALGTTIILCAMQKKPSPSQSVKEDLADDAVREAIVRVSSLVTMQREQTKEAARVLKRYRNLGTLNIGVVNILPVPPVNIPDGNISDQQIITDWFLTKINADQINVLNKIVRAANMQDKALIAGADYQIYNTFPEGIKKILSRHVHISEVQDAPSEVAPDEDEAESNIPQSTKKRKK